MKSERPQARVLRNQQEDLGVLVERNGGGAWHVHSRAMTGPAPYLKALSGCCADKACGVQGGSGEAS